MNHRGDMKGEQYLLPRIPVSTYRLQFNYQFGFSAAAEIIAYLDRLGITDIYSSPYLKACEKSLHGYDIVAPDVLNPEVGTEEEFERMIRELQSRAMGQILDFVPNHMCITSKENLWWMDVLENGPGSVYSNYFDIDWNPTKKELKDKVLLPVLGDQYGRILESGELALGFEEGAFSLSYYEHKFPIIPKTYTLIFRHRLDNLKETMSKENPHFTELLSIMTALNHLPDYTEREPEKVEERDREKEIIKKRISTLYSDSNEIRDFLDGNIRIFNGTRGDARSFDLLDELLGMQVYRLSHWRVATEEINYRRFFDINGLAAIRMENEAVFLATHSFVMNLIRQGKVTGLRLDHPDGLYDPSEYFLRLQKECFLQLRAGYLEKMETYAAANRDPSETARESLQIYEHEVASDLQKKFFYIIGEKILTRGERMPEEWPIFSTTGYVFLNSLNGLFVDTRNARVFEILYQKFTGGKQNFQDIVYEKKKLIMQVAMSGEINTLAHYLNRISEKNRNTRDFTLNSLRTAISEVVAFFPVYRTYINSHEVKDRDRQYIETCIAKARRKNPAVSSSIFEFLKEVLLLRFPEGYPGEEKKEWLDFVMRFQQITGPVMAKGLEDTTFYVYNRLVSLNEVGGMPDRFGTPLETFHGQNIERHKFWPHALITTATHDTKRGEDMRARINVLSEMPDEWRKKVFFWRRLNRKKRVLFDGQSVPDQNEEYFIYQTLVGAWPSGEMDETGYRSFAARIKDYLLKSIREAKENTSWINPDIIYEDALMFFVDSLLDRVSNRQFIGDFEVFQARVSHYGIFNSLSQVVLKMTSPGVPDMYQGTELWQFSLVDPDNRGPVDYGSRTGMLDELIRVESETGPLNLLKKLLNEKENGLIKLYTVYKTMNFRRSEKELFSNGEYMPLEGHDWRSEHFCAFLRRSSRKSVIVAVPRLVKSLLGDEMIPCGENVWGDSTLVVPGSDPGTRYRNIFTGEAVSIVRDNEANSLRLAEIFASSPVAVLEMMSGQETD
jgi:(1->4)-alpha-D-glucan 1-alpha-D-glucosylmutase